MALELFSATQICSWAPPLPQRAFQIISIGVTSDSMLFAGYQTDGKRYNYAVVNTQQWATAEGQHIPPMQPGEQFQIWQQGTEFIGWPNPPAFGTGNAIAQDTSAFTTWPYAPELYNVYGLTQNREQIGSSAGSAAAAVIADSTLQTVVGVQQQANNSWFVYFSPGTNSSVPAAGNQLGIITVPKPLNPVWLGTIGHVGALNYTYALPGGPDQLTCTLMIEPDYRTNATNPGRLITAHRGGSCIWEGILTEPQAASGGWTLTANGVGTFGTNFAAWYENTVGPTKTISGWNPDAPLDFAIARGLRWANYGVGTPAGIYLGPVQDPGSLTVTDFLNLLCTGGALTWELVQPAGASSFPPAPWTIKVYPIPTAISGNPLVAGPAAQTPPLTGKFKRTDTLVASPRIPPDLYLINTNPVSRTITSDYNTVVVYYEKTADVTATTGVKASSATFATTFATIPGSVAIHTRLEYFLDVSNAGAMTGAAAAAIGQNVLNKYIRANFATAFAVQPGQLVNVGGVPVDLGCNWNGSTVTVQVVNEAYGGEVGQAPITFLIGEYEFDDNTQTATITPYQNARTDISSVVAQLYPGKFA